MLFCLAAVLLALWCNKANRQRRAVNVIQDMGSVVYWHEAKPFDTGVWFDYSARPAGSIWLRRFLGDDYFQTVRNVNISPTDEAMKVFSDLPDVVSVYVDGFQLTDEGLRQLASVTDLQNLCIENAPNLSSESMSILRHFRKLKMLTITDVPIDGDCIKHIENSTSLRQVVFCNTRLTKEDEKRLRNLLPNATVDVETYDTNPRAGPSISPYNSRDGSAKKSREKQRRMSGL